MRIFGIDPGSQRTGYGCIDTDGSRCRVVVCGAVTAPTRTPFSDKLTRIYDELASLLAQHRPTCVAIEEVFFARNARSALKLGHVRGVAMLAASKGGATGCRVPRPPKSSVPSWGTVERTRDRSSRWSRCCSDSIRRQPRTTYQTPWPSRSAMLTPCHPRWRLRVRSGAAAFGAGVSIVPRGNG